MSDYKEEIKMEKRNEKSRTKVFHEQLELLKQYDKDIDTFLEDYICSSISCYDNDSEFKCPFQNFRNNESSFNCTNQFKKWLIIEVEFEKFCEDVLKEDTYFVLSETVSTALLAEIEDIIGLDLKFNSFFNSYECFEEYAFLIIDEKNRILYKGFRPEIFVLYNSGLIKIYNPKDDETV